MELQQNFLKAVIKEMMQPKNVPNIGKIAKVFEESVETDLSFQNILWFGRRAFSGGLSMDDVNFMTMPYKGAAAYSRVYSKQLGKDFYLEYAVPIPGKLLDIVNNQLSPLKGGIHPVGSGHHVRQCRRQHQLHHRPCGGQQGRRAADSDGQRQEG